MKIKLLLFALAIAGASMPIMAHETEGNYMHVLTSTGWKVLDLDQVDRLTFKNGTMVASDKKQNAIETISQKDLMSMTYSETMAELSGVEMLSSDEDASFSFFNGSKTIVMKADGNFTVYSESGATLVEIPAAKAGQTIDLSAIRPGIVILKSGNQSLKAIIK